MKRGYAIVLLLLLALLVWVFVGALDCLIFHEGTSLSPLFTGVTRHEFTMRVLVVFSFLLFGALLMMMLAKRRRAEERIRDLAKFPSENPYPVLRVAADGTVLYANSASQSVLQEWNCREGQAVPPEWHGMVKDVLASCAKKRVDMEHGGRVVSFDMVPVKEAGYVNLYGLDVTERKQAEEALKRRNEELTAINTIASTVSRSLDLKEMLDRALDSVLNLVGVEVGSMYVLDNQTEELVLVAYRGVSEEFADEVRTFKMGESLAGRAALTGEAILLDDVTRDPRVTTTLLSGEHICSFAAIPMKSKDKVQGVMHVASRRYHHFTPEEMELYTAVANDIGVAIENARLYEEARRREEALRESEELYRKLVAALPDAVLMTDLDGRILYASPQAKDLYGSDSVVDLLGRNSFELVAPEDRERATANARRTLAEGVVLNVEYSLLRRDGSRYAVELSTTVVRDAGGEPKGFVGVVRDITERKKAEGMLWERGEQLRQAQKMEAVGRLAGGVAHDFNNLLTAITGYSEMLLNTLEETNPMRKDVEEINKAGQQAALITHQLLAFSRKQALEPTVLDLNAVVADMDGILRHFIGEDIELLTVLEPNLGHVMADQGQMGQVIMNLVANARDAMPHGGKLTIETANVDLDENYAARYASVPPGPYVMLAVSDAGLGMDKETLSRLFEPFFTTKDVGKGTGLGVSTVYGIVKQSGGDIRVYSEPGHGTTFRIFLPRVEEAVAEAGAEEVLIQTLTGSETVLVVEDEESIRSLIGQFLRRQGYTVLEASGGDDALDLCTKHGGPIDLVITDVVMPGLSGPELARKLATPCPGTKVLYVSGYTEHASLRNGFLESGAAFLQKPFAAEALAREVRGVLDGTRGTPDGRTA